MKKSINEWIKLIQKRDGSLISQFKSIYGQDRTLINERLDRFLQVAKEFKKISGLKTGGNVAAALCFGKFVAEQAKAKGIKQVVFDRGGFLYHGRVKAFADAAREQGLSF